MYSGEAETQKGRNPVSSLKPCHGGPAIAVPRWDLGLPPLLWTLVLLQK